MLSPIKEEIDYDFSRHEDCEDGEDTPMHISSQRKMIQSKAGTMIDLMPTVLDGDESITFRKLSSNRVVSLRPSSYNIQVEDMSMGLKGLSDLDLRKNVSDNTSIANKLL